MTGLAGAGAYWTPTRTEDDGPYEPTAESKAAVRRTLDQIQKRHEETAARCALCGQLTYRLDDFGLCSKTSEPHVAWRKQVRKREATAGRRAGVRA